MSDERILIAGGGPVGLLCAWLLGRRGLPVRVFDENDGPQADPRGCATSIDPRSRDAKMRA